MLRCQRRDDGFESRVPRQLCGDYDSYSPQIMEDWQRGLTQRVANSSIHRIRRFESYIFRHTPADWTVQWLRTTGCGFESCQGCQFRERECKAVEHPGLQPGPSRFESCHVCHSPEAHEDAHSADNREVTGSNPVGTTKRYSTRVVSPVFQTVQRRVRFPRDAPNSCSCAKSALRGGL